MTRFNPILTFEQCLFDEAHIRAIYRIPINLKQDGVWRTSRGSRYRSTERHFQFYYLHSDGKSWAERFEALAPLEIRDDAEWDVHWDEQEGLALCSTFTLTHGPAQVISDKLTQSWFVPKFRILELPADGAQFGVRLPELTKEALETATREIKLIEAFSTEANRRFLELVEAHWLWVGETLDDDKRLARYRAELIDSEGAKRREAHLD